MKIPIANINIMTITIRAIYPEESEEVESELIEVLLEPDFQERMGKFNETLKSNLPLNKVLP